MSGLSIKQRIALELQRQLIKDNQEKAFAYRNKVFEKMEALRAVGDEMETRTASDFWPYPSYTELLFGV